MSFQNRDKILCIIRQIMLSENCASARLLKLWNECKSKCKLVVLIWLECLMLYTQMAMPFYMSDGPGLLC